jgi:hypothetical protein
MVAAAQTRAQPVLAEIPDGRLPFKTSTGNRQYRRLRHRGIGYVEISTKSDSFPGRDRGPERRAAGAADTQHPVCRDKH